MRRSKKFILLIVVIIMLSCSLTGCFNYRDINKVIFATTVICDTNENNDIILYYECMVPFRSSGDSSEKGKREIYKGVGSSVLQAAKDINSATSYEVNFSQCRSYIFSEKLARKGIQQYIDALNREQQFTIRPYVLVFLGDVNDLIKKVNGDEENIGTYVNELVNKTKYSPSAVATTINQYLSERYMDYDATVMGALSMKQDGDTPRLLLNKAGVFRRDALIDILDEMDTISYKALNDDVNTGVIQVNHPLNKGHKITLQIIESKTDSNINYNDGITLEKNMWIKCNIGEVEGKLAIDDEVLKQIEKNCEEELSTGIERTYNKYKNKKIDIFNINKNIRSNFKEKNTSVNPIVNTKLKVNLKMKIIGSGTIEKSY